MKVLIEADDVRNILCHHAHELNAKHVYNKIELVDGGILLSYVAPEEPSTEPELTSLQRWCIRWGLKKAPEVEGHWEPVEWPSAASGIFGSVTTALRRLSTTVAGVGDGSHNTFEIPSKERRHG